MKKSRYGAAFIILAALLFYFGFEYMHRKCEYTGFGDTENAVGQRCR